MTERRFDIVFDGKIIDGNNLPDVKSNLQSLFKLSDNDVSRLFSGQSVTIKKNLDRQTAARYQKAITQAGAKIQLILHQALHQTEQAQNNTESTVAEPTTRNAGIALTPQGGDLLTQDEKAIVEVRDIDTSHLTLEIQEQEEAVNPFLANIDDSPTISNVTTTNEIKPNDHIQLETSLTVATVGETLSPATQMSPPPLPPNVDHLTAINTGEPLLNEDERTQLNQKNQATIKNQVTIVETTDLSVADAGTTLLQAHERDNQEPIEVDTSGLTVVKTE